jgi:hypothetical protein
LGKAEEEEGVRAMDPQREEVLVERGEEASKKGPKRKKVSKARLNFV